MGSKSLLSTKSNPRGRTKYGRRKLRDKTKDPDYLPKHIARAFEDEITDLVSSFATDGFKGMYLHREFRSKYRDPELVTPEQRRSAAIEKWLLAERRNSTTNLRLFLGDVDFGWVHSDDLLRKARSYVSDVLGELEYPAVICGGSHTNGASTRVKRSPQAAIAKHSGEAHVSSSAYKHWLMVSFGTILESQEVSIQETSVLFTVPKSTEIDRVACKEPEINMFLQRTVGDHIRRRLRKKGINLNDQTTNQRLAGTAVRDGLATIDLSSASDTISEQLVRELVPFDWFCLLDDLRVKATIIDGEYHELNMFSSMGNGFTFELESLLFWALARAIAFYSNTKGTISVYGDDIIVPCSIAPRLARVFAWLGFKVNSKKSFWTGKFRESCGKHYYCGCDVTPFYLREPVRTKRDVMRLLNRLLEWDGRGWGFFLTEEASAFHRKWSSIIPEFLWGGVDPDDPSALVTGHRPRKRLVPKNRDVEYCHSAALVCWMTVRESSITGVEQRVRAEPHRVLLGLPDWHVFDFSLRPTGSQELQALELTPSEKVSYKLAKQPPWANSTAWAPHYLWS